LREETAKLGALFIDKTTGGSEPGSDPVLSVAVDDALAREKIAIA
jgi:hypothetical protein